MKFFTPVLTLLVSTSVYSRSLESKLMSRATEQLPGISQECQNQLNGNEDYNYCTGINPTVDTLKENCKKFFSDRCQNFFKDPLALFPACKSDQVFMTYFEPIKIKNTISKYEMFCSEDGEGNACPGAIAIISGNSITDKNIYDNCKSQNCINSVMEYFKFKSDNFEEMNKAGIVDNPEELQKVSQFFIGMLNDQKCTSQAKNDLNNSSNSKTNGNNDAKSGIDVVKMNSTFLIFASILFLLF